MKSISDYLDGLTANLGKNFEIKARVLLFGEQSIEAKSDAIYPYGVGYWNEIHSIGKG